MNKNESITTAPDACRVAQTQDRPVFLPAADIYETSSAVLIRCDMPGIAEQDLEVTLENKVLTVTGPQMGQGREGYETLAYETLAGEYRTGIYQRSFGLGRDVDDSAVSARLKDGVLEIKLPKARAAQPRRIPVEA